MPTQKLRLILFSDGFFRAHWVAPDGKRLSRAFGRDPVEAQRRFERFNADWQASLDVRLGREPERLTVDVALDRYQAFADAYYRRSDGSASGEAVNMRLALRFVRQAFGGLPVEAFSLQQLRVVQISMARGGLSQRVVNDSVRRVRTAWRWLCDQGMVPAERWAQLRALRPVQAGRALTAVDGLAVEVRTRPKVSGVAEEWVEAAAVWAETHGQALLGAMIRVQYLTAMRPGELLQMRTKEIDMSGRVWVYRPAQHKTAHRGHLREICIGPRAQAILRPLLPAVLERWVWRPIDAVQARHAACQTHRRAEVDEPKSTRRVGERWGVTAYGIAVRRVSAAAGMQFSPNQLRHAAATRLRKRYRLDSVQVLLGHAGADVTQVYADTDREEAARVAEEAG